MKKAKEYIEAIQDVISILERRREECLILAKEHTTLRFEYRAKADELQLSINDINKNLKK